MSALEARLATLCEEGRTREAAQLARAVLATGGVEEVVVGDDEALVATEHFEGRYALDRDGEEVDVSRQGEFRPASDEFPHDFAFRATILRDAVRDALADEQRAGEATGERDADAADRSAPDEAEDGTGAGPSGPVATLSRLLAALLRP